MSTPVGAPRLLYLVNARLPTEKAHGYQVVKMCEAFASAGCDVALWHPRRAQPSDGPGAATVFDYYGVPPVFGVRTLANLDARPIVDHLPPPLDAVCYSIHALVWGFAAALAARRRRADLYYTRDALLALWLVLLGCPTACELHRGASGSARWVLRVIGQRRAFRGVVTVTDSGRRHVEQQGIAPGRVWVAPDGVDLLMYEDLPSPGACRDLLGLPGGRPIIGYIGRLRTMDMEKGVGLLVEALGTFPDSPTAPILLCVGGPPEAASVYRTQALALGIAEDRLILMDRVPNAEVPLWIRACDVVTIPSPPTEFFARFSSPMKLFEYLAAGVPIVASDLPALREILTHGTNAWLVAPSSASALANGIASVLASDRLASALGRAGKSAAASFAWSSRATGILAACGISRGNDRRTHSIS